MKALTVAYHSHGHCPVICRIDEEDKAIYMMDLRPKNERTIARQASLVQAAVL